MRRQKRQRYGYLTVCETPRRSSALRRPRDVVVRIITAAAYQHQAAAPILGPTLPDVRRGDWQLLKMSMSRLAALAAPNNMYHRWRKRRREWADNRGILGLSSLLNRLRRLFENEPGSNAH